MPVAERSVPIGLFYFSPPAKTFQRCNRCFAASKKFASNLGALFLQPSDPSRKKILLYLLRTIVAFIFLQTLFYKFTAAPESVAIFSKLGAEPWGRIGTGILELAASILLFLPDPRLRWTGALLGLGLMSGAILSHLFVIGIEQENDGGFLFFLALASAVVCALLLWLEKETLTDVLRKRNRK
ncbi:DoxX-like family protein [Leptospira yasudae]|nr:DoxX-like family protein [Leptospira yasudae]TGM06982.1 DoxX-like family protein [Leptospira yasudae]